MDPKLVATNQPFEAAAVCRIWKDQAGKNLKVSELKKIMSEIAQRRKGYKKNQLCRSRAQIYAELTQRQYVRVPRAKSKK